MMRWETVRSIIFRRKKGLFFHVACGDHLRTGELEGKYGWFDRFYTIRDLRAVSEPRETPYAGILRLAPGEIVVFTEEGVHRRDTGIFAGRRILRGKTEAGYRELVTTVFRTAWRM